MARYKKRIYYGPEGRETSIYWTVKVDDAKESVSVNGSVAHALRGHAGVTVGCALSNTALDNAGAFPHPVYMAVFTKNTALLVDKLKKNGEPTHAVAYAHSYGHITDRNDNGTLKKMVKDDPRIIERSFTLRPPRKDRRAKGGPNTNSGRASSKAFAHRGALARAVKAGRIGKNVAQQLSEVAAARAKLRP